MRLLLQAVLPQRHLHSNRCAFHSAYTTNCYTTDCCTVTILLISVKEWVVPKTQMKLHLPFARPLVLQPTLGKTCFYLCLAANFSGMCSLVHPLLRVVWCFLGSG